MRCSPIGARHGIDCRVAVRVRRARVVAGTSAIRCRCVRGGRRGGSSRRGGPRRAVRGWRSRWRRLWRSRGGGRPGAAVVVDSRAPHIVGRGPAGRVEGRLAVAGHGGVGLDVDQVMDQHVDDGFGQDAADPVDVDRADPDDLTGLGRRWRSPAGGRWRRPGSTRSTSPVPAAPSAAPPARTRHRRPHRSLGASAGSIDGGPRLGRPQSRARRGGSTSARRGA